MSGMLLRNALGLPHDSPLDVQLRASIARYDALRADYYTLKRDRNDRARHAEDQIEGLLRQVLTANAYLRAVQREHSEEVAALKRRIRDYETLIHLREAVP